MKDNNKTIEEMCTSIEDNKSELSENTESCKNKEEKDVKEITTGFGIGKRKPIYIGRNNINYNEILLVGNLRGLFGEWKDEMDEFEGHKYPIVHQGRHHWSQEGRDNLYWLRRCLEEGARVTIIENLRPSDSIEDTYFDRVKQYMLWSLLDKRITECQIHHIKVVTDEKGKFNLNEYINKNMKTKFDICIMNAPYANGLHEKFEVEGIDLVSEEIVWIGPLTWLLGKKQNKELCNRCNQYYTQIKTIKADDHFDALIGNKMGIVTVNKKEPKNIEYNGITYSNCSEIKHFSDDLLITSAYRKIKPYSFTDNINNHIAKVNEDGRADFCKCPFIIPADNDYIFRVPQIWGNPKAFYTFIPKDLNYTELSGLYKKLKDKKDKSRKEFIKFYVKLENEQQCINFWKFIRTDFAQLCLYFIKINPHLDGGELKFVPWLDWNKEWTDFELFKLFKLTKAEVERVYEVIPNYFKNDRVSLLKEYDKDKEPLRPY